MRLALRWHGITMYRQVLYFMLVLQGVAVAFSAAGVLPYRAWALGGGAVALAALCWAGADEWSALKKLVANRGEHITHFNNP